MSGYGQGAATRHRGISYLDNASMGGDTPEHIIRYSGVAAPGAVGAILFSNPAGKAKFKILSARERHATAGAGSSVVAIRLHAAGQASAPGAAVGTGVTAAASIPADSTANTWQDVTFDDEIVEPGETLMAVTPATYAGFQIEIIGVWV